MNILNLTDFNRILEDFIFEFAVVISGKKRCDVITRAFPAKLFRSDSIANWYLSTDIIFQSMFQPYVSSLLLHSLDTDKEGLYACVIGYRGKAIATHAFGVSVYEPDSKYCYCYMLMIKVLFSTTVFVETKIRNVAIQIIQIYRRCLTNIGLYLF